MAEASTSYDDGMQELGQAIHRWDLLEDGLSAAWHMEDGGHAETALAVGALALCALRR